MKHLFVSSVLSISGLLLSSPGIAAAAPSSPAAAGDAASSTALAGEYSGKWKGKDDSGGDLNLKLTRNGSAEWVAEMEFTFDGAKMPAKLKSVRVEGTKVEIVFSQEVQGTPVVGKLTGELSGATLQGKYETDTSESAGVGSWSVTRI